MHAENLTLNDRRERQVVEQGTTHIPHVCIAVLLQAFVVKAIALGHRSRLVVPPQESDPVPVAHFQRNQQTKRLDACMAAIHVVTHEDIASVGRFASDREQLLQVVELAMSITADRHRRPHFPHIRLGCENFLGLLEQISDLSLCKSLEIEQHFNLSIKISRTVLCFSHFNILQMTE